MSKKNTFTTVAYLCLLPLVVVIMLYSIGAYIASRQPVMVTSTSYVTTVMCPKKNTVWYYTKQLPTCDFASGKCTSFGPAIHQELGSPAVISNPEFRYNYKLSVLSDPKLPPEQMACKIRFGPYFRVWRSDEGKLSSEQISQFLEMSK